MIPKVIHYCWFGKNELPKSAKKCINSWKKKCSNYKIVKWDEDNFDISTAPLYVRQAYEAKKWAFVTDYVRLKVVYENGGIYLDTDVQLLKNLDEFLMYKSFFGFENNYIATGLGFGAEKGAKILKDIMEQYDHIPFIDKQGNQDQTPCPKRNTEVFINYGLKQNNSKQLLRNEILILPMEYLCPLNFETMKLNKTANTVSIHWFSNSWYSKSQKKLRAKIIRKRKKQKIIKYFGRIIPKIIGETLFNKIKQMLIKSEILSKF